MTKTDADRTSEIEIAIGALQIMRDLGGEASIARIKESIPDYVELTAADKAVSQMRPREPLYAQIVGNIVFHCASAGNIIFERYAVYDEYKKVLSITDAGRAYLENKDYEESRPL
jgi:hypothetical protein